MATVSVFNTDGKEVETIELSDKVFGVEINENIVHKAVVAHLAAKRQGTQSARTRSEVSGGGRKPWRQKGTGHARQGSIRAPQWTGGGVVFAPKPRDYSQKINKKEARLALFSALTSKVQDNKLIVVDELSMEAPKTKNFVTILGNLKADKALVVTENADKNVVLSARNIPDVKTEARAAINVYDILKHDSLVITKDAVKALEEVYA
ncbi:large subunit ribosomal protein L4 [Lachnospiraceae bacterium]|nr:large subunit ribosomal protein L4 [Lachnospiraceae bacterium]